MQRPDWLNVFQDPGVYPHPVSQIQLIETHISWVILTGDWVYKLKKPVLFRFVDFTTLELRRAACSEEVRLNKRTANSMYDGVVALTDDADGPQFGGTGPVIEYAVRMRQFSQTNLLGHCLERDALTVDMIDTLAREIADLHRGAAVATAEMPFGEPDVIGKAVEDCLAVLSSARLANELRMKLESVSQWCTRESCRLRPTFVDRKRQGWIRECHGDLHLGNLVLYGGRPTLFDCLEFNPQLRWIDVVSDIAFLVMDLHDRNAARLASHVLNRWLEQIGDFQGLDVLRYYLAYRALVRANVAALRLQQPDLPVAESALQHEFVDSYVQLASTLIQPGVPAIVLMQGVSGSGKSFVAREVASYLSAIHIRSDVERKRLFAAFPSGPPSSPPPGMYSPQATQKTYLRLQELTRTIVGAGYSVIVDAAFLRRQDRGAFAELAKELSVPFVILACFAPKPILLERILQRSVDGKDASDADANILEHQFAATEPLDLEESSTAVVFDTSVGSLAVAMNAIRDRIAKQGQNASVALEDG